MNISRESSNWKNYLSGSSIIASILHIAEVLEKVCTKLQMDFENSDIYQRCSDVAYIFPKDVQVTDAVQPL